MYKKFLTTFASLLVIGAFSTGAFAAGAPAPEPAEQGLEATATPEIGYYDMTPDFTTNLSSSGAGRLHYLRIHVNVMVKDSNDLPLVTLHDPLIRDAILTIIGSKEYGAIATAAGREALRAECRARVAELLEQKKGSPVIQDLLFTNYVYQ